MAVRRDRYYTEGEVTRMNRLAVLCAALIAFVTLLPPAHASADQRKVGDRIVYDMQMGLNAQQTMKNTLTVTIDRVDGDGSAHALVTIDAAHQPQLKTEATVSPAGEILAKTDTAMPKLPGLIVTPAQAKAMQQQEMAVAATSTITMNLRTFNAFAAATAGRKKLKVGDTFKASGGGYGGGQVTYKVTGREQHLGHDSFAVSIQSAPGAMESVSGQGYYDPAAHLVVAFHADQTMQQGTQVFDITLKP